MRHLVTIVAFLLMPTLQAAENPPPTLEQRVEALEREVQDLKKQMDEAAPSGTTSPKALKPARSVAPAPVAAPAPAPIDVPGTPPGWQDKINWKKLRYGMLQPQVQALLGDPVKVEGTRYNQRWLYPDDSAWVQFDSEKEVNGWQAP